jgi:predicted Zn finger-like uncharacterized protein
MLIVCPNCATSYDVEVASLRPNGRRVRCVRCRMVWQAELPHADKLIAAAAALAPARATADAVAEAAGWSSQSEEFGVVPSAESAQSGDATASAVAGDSAAVAAKRPTLAARNEDAAWQSPEVESPPIAPVDVDAVDTDLPPDGLEAEQDHAAEFEPPQDVESVAARRAPRPTKKGVRGLWPLTRLQSAVLALIIIDAIIVGWRADFVKLMPQTESFYALIGMPVNLRGLSFDGITTSTEQHEGVPILVVEGHIINTTHKLADVPHLRFAVRNAARQEIYSWTAAPPRPILPPGEGIGFRTRLASPPPDAHDVLVRFLNRYDIMNGAR